MAVLVGTLSNKGGREQRNRQEIGAGATSREFRGFATRATGTKKPPCRRRLPTMIRGLLPRPRGFPLPGSFLLASLFCAEKWIFPENLVLCITLIYCNSLKLPQSLTYPTKKIKFRLAQIATTWMQAHTVPKQTSPSTNSALITNIHHCISVQCSGAQL